MKMNVLRATKLFLKMQINKRGGLLCKNNSLLQAQPFELVDSLALVEVSFGQIQIQVVVHQWHPATPSHERHVSNTKP